MIEFCVVFLNSLGDWRLMAVYGLGVPKGWYFRKLLEDTWFGPYDTEKLALGSIKRCYSDDIEIELLELCESKTMKVGDLEKRIGYCAFIFSNGNRCEHYAMAGSEFCYAHHEKDTPSDEYSYCRFKDLVDEWISNDKSDYLTGAIETLKVFCMWRAVKILDGTCLNFVANEEKLR